jgi:hypothetical protein
VFERVASTAIQVLLAFLAVDGMSAVDWSSAINIVGLSALASLLKNILANLPSDSAGPSLVSTEKVVTAP